jgi:hypothetical protein
MGQTKTNNFSIAYAEETSPGVLGGSPVWKTLEPNNITEWGGEYETVARTPISKRRQRRKGKTTDKSSAVGIEHDTTMDPMDDFLSAFVVARWQGTPAQRVLSCDTNSFTVADVNVLFPVNTFVHVRGMVNAVNNGVHLVNGTPSDTDIPVSTVLVAEGAPPANAVVERAGVRGAAGDLRIDAAGDLISTVLNFTTLPLYPGQTIWIGGAVAANQFFQQANADTNYGFARIVSVAANKLTLDKTTSPFVLDDGTSTGAGGTARQIDLFFGRFLRNVDVDNVDYIERTYHFEGAFDNLWTAGATAYEYAIGNYANELSLSLPETDKSTVTFGFIGIDTEEITNVRKAGASTALEPVRTDSFSTSTDIARLRVQKVDESGLTTCFKSLTLTLQNNVEPEKCLGTLGSPFINLGNFFVNMETTVLFTDAGVINAIRNNETIGLDFVIDNDDGALAFDIPAMTLGGGTRELPQNQSIRVSLTGEAFGDPTYSASLLVSHFPFIPAV